ncbi:NADPH:quinone reductase-like Zn-dependent oxidoreductase [Actinomadura pelletieri DSM 43383]|uniref:NADPH:quinone reductase-like Zn-dependent oxidoreductase n=1 Tax=Actinomadura pelletieri DSM 43383 TaxID=1120940 RepID=A0A495QTQ8_9ACTN|nr:NADP-dependent oxidoreductase [Actinomadura pelletieri]RKS76904.1 NADPH:quinone reductase-like Zn-dependent oxidoreductase [Actinomadura pelletieri DSM 43383]
MRVAGFTEPGGPEVLRILDVPVPEIGPGEVRVRVRTAGVQPFDLAVRAGWTPPGTPEGLPRVPGNEFAGVVDEIGDGVTAVSPGEEVLGYCRLNAYAEYVVVPETALVRKPTSMGWEVAGGFPAAVMTPHIALEEMAVGPGDTLLVHAAAGAVGTVAVQLGRAAGATVIGTASEPNHDYLRSIGAIPVAYGDGLEERVRSAAPNGVDAALDGAGGDALAVSLKLVEDRNRIITMVEHERAAEFGVRITPHKRSASRVADAARLYDEGRLKIHVRGVFPLDRAADAHREVATGHGRGKVVLAVQGSG